MPPRPGAPAARRGARPPSRGGAGAGGPSRRAGARGDTKRKATSDARGEAVASFSAKRCRQGEEPAVSITETATPLSDEAVAGAISRTLRLMGRPISEAQVWELMRRWRKPILKARIPGAASARPMKAALDAAKSAVLRFYAREAALGDESDVARAFYAATGEARLRFDWPSAMGRIRRASFDNKCRVDAWTDCLAMTSGATYATSEIYICGTKHVTQRALTSLLCHEGLHNLARRVRPGNTYLSEDLEHIAMALLGDPQLVHQAD